mgnify:CR=1 FL=1
MNPRKIVIRSHTLGKRVINPKKTRIPPEKPFQKLCGISIKIVDAFKRRVKRTMETAREKVITKGLQGFLSATDPPRMIGRSGRTQGAKIVSIPATKETRRSSMDFEKKCFHCDRFFKKKERRQCGRGYEKSEIDFLFITLQSIFFF